jgi:hypothetical protein
MKLPPLRQLIASQGNSLPHALVNMVQGQKRRVEPALARLRLFALGFHWSDQESSGSLRQCHLPAH